MVRYTFLILLIISSISNAQIDFDKIRENVQSNIVSSQLAKLVSSETELTEKNYKEGKDFLGSWTDLLMRGHKLNLEMDIELQQDLLFPDTNYVIMKIKVNKFIFSDTSTSILVTIPPSHSICNDDFLIAVKKYTNHIIYISGDFYKNQISNYFPNLENELTLKNFIHLKLYILNFDKIDIYKNTKKKWFISILKDNEVYKFEILKRNPDIIFFRGVSKDR